MSEPSSGWGRQFDEPIELPNGRKLVVLCDAASYITALPKKESAAPEWQAAIEALMLLVDLALSANHDKFTAAPASKRPAGGCRQAYRA